MTKTFIFDWSGTLNNNFDCFCQVYELMRKELNGQLLSKKQIKETFTLPYMKFWNIHFPDLTKEKQDKLYKKFINQVGKLELYPTTIEIIEHLHKSGHNLFVISSDPISTLIPEIKKSTLSDLFIESLGGIFEKQYAILHLLKKYNLNSKNTYYIGDTSGDIEAGKIAGVKTIGISWGFQTKEKLSKSNPDYLINDIIEIKNLG